MKKKFFSILVLIFISIFFLSCKNPILIEESGLYEVSFETNGGTRLTPYRTQCIKFQPKTIKDGFYLEGWYETSNFSGKKIEFPYEVTRDTVLYARWIENTKSYYKIQHYKQNINTNTFYKNWILF